MGYHITYNPDLNKKYPFNTKSRGKLLTITGVLLLCFVAIYVLAQSDVMHYFIPGDPEITAEAFSLMVERVSQGETVGNAVVGFCREIISSSH